MSEQAMLDELREYSSLQAALIQALLEEAPEDLDEFSLRDRAPKHVWFAGERWVVEVHGTGVRFVECTTGTVVDAHSGMFREPSAFDDWRLGQYYRSRGIALERSEVEIRGLLDRLASLGEIRPAEQSGHFLLTEQIPDKR